MASTSFVLILTFINLLLWVVFFVALKKRFSPKNVLDDIKDEVDKLLIVMNQETDRDLTLLEAKLSEIHEALKYADYVLEQVKGDESISNPDYGKKIEMHEKQQRNEESAVTVSISEEARNGAQSYRQEAVEWEQHMELFAGASDPQPVPDEGAARKVNRQQVIDLWQMGQSVSEIAQRLDVDMTSVQMIIDMFS